MPKARTSAKKTKLAAPPAHRPSVLKRLREERGLTQQQLADRINTSQPQIERLENGKRTMRKHWAVRLAAALDTHWFVLMGEAAPTLTPKEQEMLRVFRGLSDDGQDTVFKVAAAHQKAEAAESK
jgi:UDP-N-acetylglucosamine 1-carboxyvinyltransferase